MPTTTPLLQNFQQVSPSSLTLQERRDELLCAIEYAESLSRDLSASEPIGRARMAWQDAMVDLRRAMKEAHEAEDEINGTEPKVGVNAPIDAFDTGVS